MKINLGNGKFALIDDADWTKKRKHYNRKGVCTETAPCEQSWRLCNRYVSAGGGTKPKLLLHRLLIECPPNSSVDHINGNALDNRQCNIRICDDQQNQRNQRKRTKSRCAFKGVMVNKTYQRLKPYRARIVVDGEKIHIGYYQTQLEAAIAYDTVAVGVFGEFASLNFPERLRLAVAVPESAGPWNRFYDS